MDVQIKIPDKVFSQTNASRLILETVALEGYKSNQLTSAQVGRILGFTTRSEILEFLTNNEIPWIDYSIAEAEGERNLLKELLP